MGYYENSSNRTVENPGSVIIKSYNISDIDIWNKLDTAIPFGNKSIKMPEHLEKMENFPLNNLVREMQQDSFKLEPMRSNNFPIGGGGYILTTVATVIIMQILLVLIVKYKSKFHEMFCLAKKSSS